jgi:CubicO group peptidase (beta-lactamase class C family)/peptidoglycan/xylan/chitin deacetylase (PgdA/CDA1 family)
MKSTLTCLTLLCLCIGLSIPNTVQASRPDANREIRLAITLDDLPWVGPLPKDTSAQQALSRIAAVLRVHKASATGFVVCDRAKEDEAAIWAWAAWGNTLGNHSSAHQDLNSTPVDEWLAGVASCDQYLQRFGDSVLPLLRFPYLHEGPTVETRQLAKQGIERLSLSTAHVTVDNSEWILTRAHAQALDTGDATARRRAGEAFVEHIVAAVKHADEVGRRKAGRGVAQILLLHANTIVDDYLDELLIALRHEGVRFITINEALADPIYAREDEYAGPKGLSWLYRMAPLSVSDVAWDDEEAEAISKAFGPDVKRQASETREPFVSPHVKERLKPLVDRAGQSERMRSLLVAQGGERIVEAYFNGSSADQPANLKSVTKSLLATLVGVAIDRGWIANVDDPIALYLPTRFAEGDPNAGITIRELLTMTSGLPAVPYGDIQDSHDWVETVLAETRQTNADNPFRYDTPVLQILSGVLTHVSRMTISQFFESAFADLPGFELEYWRTDAQGLELGGNDAYLKPLDLLALGELYRNEGKVGDRIVLSAEYVRAATSRQSMPRVEALNHGTLPTHGYGYLWWLITAADQRGYAALGHGGQMLAVFPDKELTVVMTSRWPMASSAEHYRHMTNLLNGIVKKSAMP